MKNTLSSPGIILFLLSFVFPCVVHAQKTHSFALDIEPGIGIITSKQVRKVYNPGLKFLAGPKMQLAGNSSFWLRVHGGFQWHFKEVERVNSITDHLRIFKAGTQVQYFFSENNTRFAVFAGLNYNWCANYFSATYNYNPWTNTAQTVASDKFLKGSGVSADLGAFASFKNVYFKLGYEYLKPNLNVNPEIVKSAFDGGISIPAKYRYNLSSLSLSVGYTLNL